MVSRKENDYYVAKPGRVGADSSSAGDKKQMTRFIKHVSTSLIKHPDDQLLVHDIACGHIVGRIGRQRTPDFPSSSSR